jgi:hypothetical protein
MKRLFFLFFTGILITGCSKNLCPNSELGVLHNYKGLDGCGWVIEINGNIYEPVNINDFNANYLVEGKQVNVIYEAKQAASICMVGQTITISCLSEN